MRHLSATNPILNSIPKAVQDFYIEYLKKTKLNEVPMEKRAKWVEIRNRIIKAIYDAGGKIMAGSDTPEFLWLYGYSLHRELKALNEAGLTPFATLQSATVNPAEFFGTSAETGTIEVGKRADLVLLNANPLKDISNTTDRAGVMLGGIYYDNAQLQAWLDTSASRISQSYLDE